MVSEQDGSLEEVEFHGRKHPVQDLGGTNQEARSQALGSNGRIASFTGVAAEDEGGVPDGIGRKQLEDGRFGGRNKARTQHLYEGVDEQGESCIRGR